MSRVRLPAEQRRSFEISSLANPKLLCDASVLAYVANNRGEPSPGGKFLHIQNQSTQDVYFATAGHSSGMTFLGSQQSTLIRLPSSPLSGLCSTATVFRIEVLFTSRRKPFCEPPQPGSWPSTQATPAPSCFDFSSSFLPATAKAAPCTCRTAAWTQLSPPSLCSHCSSATATPAHAEATKHAVLSNRSTAIQAGLPRHTTGPGAACQPPSMVSGLNPPTPTPRAFPSPKSERKVMAADLQ
jgi:hypothetical protein